MKILIHNTSPLISDPRPQRFAEYFKSNKYEVVEVFHNYRKQSKIKKLSLFILWLFTKKHLYLKQFLSLNPINFKETDDVNFHFVADPLILPFLNIKRHKKIIMDLREYHLENQQGILFYLTYKRIYKEIYKNDLKKAAYIFTVSEKHKQILQKKFKLESIVILSAPFLSQKEISKKEVNPNEIKFVYFGLANKNRGIKLICDSFIGLKNRTLDLHLTGDKQFIEMIKKKYKNHNNISIYEINVSVKDQEVLLNYDVGMCIFNKPWNTKQALPNKFFTYIHAGLSIFALQNTQMGDMVTKYSLGPSIQNFKVAELRNTIFNLQYEDVCRYQANSLELKYELNFLNESYKFEGLFK